MTATVPVIRIEALTKVFGSVRALDGLDLLVQPGEVHGFLGPNGAGKSTTIRVLLGLMKATSGRVELFGGDPWHDAPRLHARLAYVAGHVALWPGLTGGQLETFAAHDLEQHDQLEFTTTLNFPGIRTFGRQHANRDIAEQFGFEPVLDLTGSDLVTLPAGQRRSVLTDDYRK